MTLKEARELADLTQRRLSELTDRKVKVSSISDVEVGRIQNPSHAFVVRVVRALHKAGMRGVTAEQIFPIDDSVSGDGAAA